MQFTTCLITLAILATGAIADLHSAAVCYDNVGDAFVYNAGATENACKAYLARNTGTNQWDTCPDCKYVSDEPAHCQSDGAHLGGDEISQYCIDNGAAGSKAN